MVTLSLSLPLSLSLADLRISTSLLLRKVLLQQLGPSHHAQRLPDSQEHPGDHPLEESGRPLLPHHHREDPENGQVGLAGVGPGLRLDAGELW